MTLSRLSRRTPLSRFLLKSTKTLHYPFSQIQAPFSKSISTNASDDSMISNDLISIFTKRPFSMESQELKHLGSKLNTNIVETALKGFKNWKVAQEFFKWASNQHGYKHNCYTYNTMASILSRARQNASLRALAVDIWNSRCYMTPGALGFFIRCLGSQGLVEEANVLFDQVKKSNLCVPNSYSYNCLLEAISKSSNVDLIDYRLNEMRGFGLVPDKYALTPVLHCYCNAGEFEKALDVFNQMYEKGWVDAYVLSILVVSFSKWGKVDKAFQMVEIMEDQNIFLNEKTFRVLIHGFVKEGRVDKAMQLLDKMQRWGYNPDISIYGVLVGGLCKSKEFKKAIQLCKQMNQWGIRSDVKIFSEIVSCAPEDRDVICLVESRQEDLDNEVRVLLFNSVLKGLVNNGSVDKAYNLLKAAMGGAPNCDFEVAKLIMHGELVKPDTNSFETVVNGLCQADKLDMALDLFQDMDRLSCRRSILLYNNLIDCLSKSDRLSECYVLLQEMKDSGFRPTQFTYNSIFGCLCRQEDVAGAVHMLREMRVHGHDPWIKYYTLLIDKLCKHGRAIEACSFLTDMIQIGFLPDVIGYSAAIYGLFQIHAPEKALQLFRDLCSRGYYPDVVACNIVINGLCKAEKLADSQDILNEMLEKGLVPSTVTYNLLIDGWCKVGDMEKAIRWFTRMVEEEREPNVITYTTLIDGFCNAGRPNDAQKLWAEMNLKGCSPNRIAFMALINGLCKCRKLDEAMTYLCEMKRNNMTPDAFVIVSLIDAFVSNSNSAVAYDLLKEMVHNQNFPDSNDKNHLILKDAINFLSREPRMSSNIKSLMADGSIPIHLCTSEVEKKIECKPLPDMKA